MRRAVMRGQDMLTACALAFVLGAASVGWDCGAKATAGSPAGEDGGSHFETGDTGDSSSDSDSETSGGDTSGFDAAAFLADGSFDGDALPSNSPFDGPFLAHGDAAHDAKANPDFPDAGTPACIGDQHLCSVDGPKCCSGMPCNSGVCGVCIAQATGCDPGGAPCCDGLTCTNNKCGVPNVCAADGTACESGGLPCCADDCVNGFCGGSADAGS